MFTEGSSLINKHRGAIANAIETPHQQTIRARILRSSPFFVCTLALIVGLVGTNCPGEVKYSNKNLICRYLMADIFHGNEMLASSWMVLLPMFLASIYAFIHDPKSAPDTGKLNEKISLWTRFWVSWVVGGDPNIKLWCFIIIVCPAIYIVFDAVFNFGSEVDIAKWEKEVLGLALSTGHVAVVALSFFMIPVSKQSVLLAAFGLSPIQALTFHIWAGRVCLVCTIIHGLIFSLALGFFGMEEQGHGFFSALISALIPPKDCFRFSGIMSFMDSDALNAGCEEEEGRRLLMDESQAQTCCYGYMRNFTGFISATALIILGITSINWMRRKYYRFFYISHIITGGTMLLGAVLHFQYIAVYILPSLIYYFCTTSPVLIQILATYFVDNGCKLEQTTIIGSSNGCAEMVFPKTSACSEVENKQAAPYVRICVPEISLLWYPFTVATTPHDKNTKLKLLFRKYGYFTTNLLNILKDEGRKPPVILIDGFYYGSDWCTKALQHDEILVVTGGIGITPFLSMIRMLFDKVVSASDEDSFRLKKIHFHWYCRDKGLIRHVVNNHFAYFVKECEVDRNAMHSIESTFLPFSLELSIHFTGNKEGDEGLFSIHDKLSSSEHLTILTDTSDTDSFQTNSHSESSDVAYKTGSYQVLSSKAVEISTGVETFLKDEETFTRNFSNAHGTSVEPSRFSLGQHTLLSTFLFSMAFLGSFFFHRYYYKNFIEVYQFAVAFRGYSTYVIILWSILIGVLFELIQRYFLRNSGSQIGLTEDQQMLMEEGIPEKVVFPFSAQVGNKMKITMDLKHGRPILRDVVDGAVNAELPAVFFCGPSKLLTGVKKEIKMRRKGLMSKCCYYEEEFEM